MRPDITHWELIRHLANKDSQIEGDGIVQLLESMHNPMTPTELSEKYPIKRAEVHDVTDLLEPWGVERIEKGARKITTAGEIARRAYEEAVEEIDSDDLAWLARSDNRGQILDELRTSGPISANELSEVSNLPDKRTIRRSFDGFDDRNWVIIEERVEKRRYVAKLNMGGERVSRVYDNLLEKMEQVIDKSPCLQDLELECANIPIKALTDAELVETSPRYAFKIEKRVKKLSNEEFQFFRGFQSHWNGENAKAFYPLVADGRQFEIISPPLGLDALPTDKEEVKCVVGGLKAENYQWHMYPKKLPCSLAILDTEQMVVGPRDPGAASDMGTGAIISHNDELVEWAMDMYETHRQQTKDPFDVSFGFSISVDDLIELLSNRFLSGSDEGSLSR